MTRCDVTGKLRQTELRFVCNEAAIQEFIGDIVEPPTYAFVPGVSQFKTTDVSLSILRERPKTAMLRVGWRASGWALIGAVACTI